VDDVERRRAHTWASILIEARFVPVLRNQFGRHCHADGESDGGFGSGSPHPPRWISPGTWRAGARWLR